MTRWRWAPSSARLRRRLQIDVEARRRTVLEADGQAIHRLLGGRRLVVPDRGEGVANVDLVDLGHGHLAELWQHVKFKRREPASRLAVAFQPGLARFQAIPRHILQLVQIAFSLKTLPLTFLDRFLAFLGHRAPRLGLPARLFQGNSGQPSQAISRRRL
nr:hypothetical protein [Sedimentitalea xiamensis]